MRQWTQWGLGLKSRKGSGQEAAWGGGCHLLGTTRAAEIEGTGWMFLSLPVKLRALRYFPELEKAEGELGPSPAWGHPIWRPFPCPPSTTALQAPERCSALLCWRVSAEKEVHRGQSGACKEPWIQPGLHSEWTHYQLCNISLLIQLSWSSVCSSVKWG